ncbi:MAG: secretin N-terminal domain-containing protein [Burkholderiales bacterium]
MAALVVALWLGGCAPPPPFLPAADPAIRAEMDKAAERRRPPAPAEVEQALLPPLRMEMPAVRGQPIDQRFDLSVSNAPATQVFMSIVSGTRYSMLLHPGVSGSISVNLKDVTIREALDSLRELYGYDYRVEGTRIFVQPAGLQTRVFQVSYLPGQRRGLSDVRVQSGAVSDAGPATGAPGTPTAAPGAATSRSLESTRVTTQQQSDFWADLRAALVALVGSGEGRSVVVTSQSGVVVVRAMPSELRAIEQYLRATRLAVERQVMLEAKILEVTLSDGYQAGINWTLFRNSGPSVAVGQLSTSPSPNVATQLGTRGQVLGTGTPPGGLVTDTAARTMAVTAGALGITGPAGAVFGIALQTSNFAALLDFLESQGSVQVLSSPRIATINNQKAVLKVGTDEFFVTNVSTTTTTTGTSSQQSPTVTVQPFFSGIVLDVTPQIDENGNIILHIHPAISDVSESTRIVNLGGQIAEIRLPLAKSTVSESDAIVRVTDGNIVAIGGLMSVDIEDARGGLPGVGDLFRNTSRTVRKKELVILLKPTVIQSDRNWEGDIRETRERLESLGQPPGTQR